MKLTPIKKLSLALLLALLVSWGCFTSIPLRQLYRSIKITFLHPVLKEIPETHEIANYLKIVDAHGETGPLRYRRIGRDFDGGYVVPETAIQKADAVLGYGISDDISFEEATASLFGKPSWGFDGTCPMIETNHPLCHFIPQCIVSNQAYLANANGNSTFNQQIEQFGLLGKKLFIKMDIEGNEYDVLPDILSHAQNITGMVLEIHFDRDSQIPQTVKLLQHLSQYFHLVHVHGNNCCLDCFTTSNAKGPIPRILELTYINKNLVHKHEFAQNQSHPTSLDMPNAPSLADASFTVFIDTE